MTSADVHDVAVVGGGPAGLSVAIRARMLGLSVIVLDRSRPGHDKACGEGLMPRAVRHLDAMGVRLREADSRPFRGIRFIQETRLGEVVAEGRFPGSPGLGVRRPALHAALARRASELGAELHWESKVSGLGDRVVYTEAGAFEARFIVGADGLHSRVRRWAGLDATAGEFPRRFGLRRHLRVKPWSECVEVWWRDGVEAYVTPVQDELVGVNVTWSGDRPAPARFDDFLAGFPRLADRLRGAEAASDDRGAGPMRQVVRRVTDGRRIALLGDASGYVDSIAGEGLALAFAQADVLARALKAGDLAAYETGHARVSRMPGLSTRTLLALAMRPRLRRAAFSTLRAIPGSFSALLAITSAGGPQGASSGMPAGASLPSLLQRTP